MIEWVLSLKPWEQAAVSVIGAIAIAQILDVVITHMARIFHKRNKSEIAAIVLDGVRGSTYLTVMLGGIVAALYLLDSFVTMYLQALVMSALIVIWSVTAIRVGRHVFEYTEQDSALDHDFIPVFENLWTFAVLILGVFAFLSVWGIDITPLLASAGIAGVAIGFAAKDTVANFFGGIALYFDNTYKEGDYVALEGGTEGTVIDVGVRSTMLKTRDGTITTVPNSLLNAAKITNQSAPDSYKRLRVPVGVSYDTDIERVQEILTDVAEDEEFIADDRPIKPMFREFGDSALLFELFCWVDDPLNDIKAIDALNQSIYHRFAEEGVEIPFPQRDVHLSSDQEPDGST